MIINEKSWHYRFTMLGENSFYSAPTSLCPYVRHLFFKGLVYIGILFMLGFTLTMLGSCVLGAAGVAESLLFWIGSFFAGIVTVAVVAGVVVGIGFGCYFVYNKIKERKAEKKRLERKARRDAGLDPEPPKTLMREWIDAKHDKICPNLVFKNDES